MNPGGSISTRVRISEPGNYRYTIRYQAASTPVTGSIWLLAYRGTVDYTTWPFSDQGCPDQNNFTEQTGGQVQTPVNTTRVPTSSWLLFSQNLGAISAEGVRIRIEVINNTSVPMRIDNFALEEI